MGAVNLWHWLQARFECQQIPKKMEKAFHDFLLAEIKRMMPGEANTVKVLMQVLQASKSNVYKKLKGDIAFSAVEMLTMARHFDISLDQFALAGNGDFHKVSIDYFVS